MNTSEENKQLSCDLYSDGTLKCSVQLDNEHLTIKTNNTDGCNNCLNIFISDNEALLIKNLDPNILINKTCLCENGTYLLNTKNSFTCEACPSSCTRCESELNCTECKIDIPENGLCKTCLEALDIEDCISCQIESGQPQCTKCAAEKNVSLNCTDGNNKEEKEEDPDLKQKNILIFHFGKPTIYPEKNKLSFYAYFFALSYNSNYVFSLIINLIIINNNRILSEETQTKAYCTQTNLTYIDENNYLYEAFCEGKDNNIENNTSFEISSKTENDSYITISRNIALSSKKMSGNRFDINSALEDGKKIFITVDKIQKKNGWSNNGYSLSLISKKPINNNDEAKKISINFENDKDVFIGDVEIPIGNNLSNFDVLVKNPTTSGGNFKVKGNSQGESNDIIPDITVFAPLNKIIYIEKKPELSKAAKIGIIVGTCALFVICVTVIIIYKIHSSRKKKESAKYKEYKIVMEKYGNIKSTEEDNLDMQSKQTMIKNRSDKFRKE